MEINNDIRTLATASTDVQAADASMKADRLPTLSSVTGEIIDLKKDMVSVATENGIITGKLKELLQANIGDMQTFTVKYGDKGEIILEAKKMSEQTLQKAALTEALASAGMKNTPENIKMALELLNNGLALNKEMLTKFNQALKLLGADKTSEALFILKNEVRINPKNAETLSGILKGELKLLNQINSLGDSINSLENTALQDKLVKLITGDETSEIIEGISKEIQGGAVKEASPEILNKAVKAFSEASPADIPKLAEAFRELVAKNPEAFEKALSMEEMLKAGFSEAMAKDMPEKGMTLKDAVNKLANAFEAAAKLPLENLDGKLTELLNKGTASVEEIMDLLKAEIGEDKLPKHLPPHELKFSLEKLTQADPVKKLMNKLKFNPENTEPKDLEKFLNGLKESLNAAKSELQKSESPEAARLYKEMTNVTNNLEFSAQLKQNVFLQFPNIINEHEANAEFFVFNDRKARKKGGATTALIALDTLAMGRVETYVQKDGREVNCQFRIRDEKIQLLISQNLEKLNNLLKGKGYNLQAYSFKQQTEPFTLIDKHEGETATEVDTEGVKRIIFDMRM